jgi:hypothetical protein
MAVPAAEFFAALAATDDAAGFSARPVRWTSTRWAESGEWLGLHTTSVAT